ncbi:DUF7857 domain-containing protein [Halorubellus salinus]|uniref:DUF7857 domain-containing protein n=1 Tax=Halorubellus salinus TaxID=755309 RepID=UPI001D061879|nr:hypothetical protein [Halorubellus salinus]
MIDVRVRTSRRDGVTFATVVVENRSSERRRVRLAVSCEGALWPPRRRGVPAAGWDAEGVTLTVAAGGVRGVGFATPASTVDVERVATQGRGGVEPEATTAAGSTDANAPDVDGVVRALGSFAPPLAATPRENAGAEGSDEPVEQGANAASGDGDGWGA